MEIDSNSKRVVQRLVVHGVPAEYLKLLYQGTVNFATENKSRIPGLVTAILPTNEDELAEEDFQECMTWLKWLMFENDPADSLAKLHDEQHYICGALWCEGDIAYQCRTCEVDRTCSICVSCFEKGDHNGHKTYTLHSHPGRCDCGDVTRWKGFCSEHTGNQPNIQPLEDDNSVGPVLDSLFKFWINKLSYGIPQNHYADKLTDAIVHMLLEFCKQSGSLQSLISTNVISSNGLMELLIKSERILGRNVVNKLHELLFELLKQDSFKNEFANEFIKYYRSVVKEIIEEQDDELYVKYHLIADFSKFLMPTLTPLVEEHNRCATLFACLEDIFVASSGEDGRLESTKWRDFYQITIRVVEDIRIVIKHAAVSKLIMFHDLLRTWFKLLSYVQGMNPLKRGFTINEDEQLDFFEVPFQVVELIGNINYFLVVKAFDVSSTNDENTRHGDNFQVPDSVICLTNECLKTIENCLGFSHSESTESQHLDLGILNFLEWPDIAYDAISLEISVHSPLHRFLSMILHNVLSKSGGNVDIFGNLLMNCHPCGFSAFIMEHPLRVRVFCAQHSAGMWNENGIISVLSYEWYLNARWSEGLESDLFLLQFCAAFAPPDLYIERILGRFGLSDYLSLNLEKSSEYEQDLVRDMLVLIIQVVQERRFCGFTVEQSLTSALVCQLASGDATHGELVEFLPYILARCDQFKEILDTVASYSDPTESTEGKYSLRSTCWNELDLYHFRWKSMDLEAAGENYTRFCRSSPICNQLPRWTKIYPPLQGIAKTATCKTVLQIIRAVLFYAVYTKNSSDSRASDWIVVTALHLISLALDICFQQKEPRKEIPLLAFACEEIGDEYKNGAAGHSLLSLLVLLLGKHKKEKLHSSGDFEISPLVESLVKKFSHIDSRCMNKVRQLAPALVSGDINVAELASESDKRKAEARERQALIMKKMKVDQAQFLSSIDSTEIETGPEASDSTGGQVCCSLCRESDSSGPISFLILLQKSRLLSFINKGRPSWDKENVFSNEQVSMAASRQSGTDASSSGSSISNIITPCAFNDDRSFVTFENEVYASFWKEIHSKMLDDDEADDINQDEPLLVTEDIDSSCNIDDDFGLIDCDGICVTSCGHAMHQECLDHYFSVNNMPNLSAQGEFLCPVCRLPANSVLPALAGDFHKQSVDISEESNSLRLRQAVFLLQFVAKRIENNDIFKAAASSLQINTETMPNLKYVTQLLFEMYFLRNSRQSPAVLFWDTLKYSIMSMEVVARGGRSPNYSLDALYRQLQSPNGFALSLLVKIVKNLENKNSIHALQRFRGLKLFSESICSGVSLCGTSVRGGEMLCPDDIQFWNWASHPILSRDPFASLMWVIFCVPSPFVLCEETYIFLLHIFYAVIVAQAIIAHCAKGTAESKHSIINNVRKIMGESQQHFVSNYVDTSSDILDVIRESSFPYLRRCALLWKLLSSSLPAPYSEKNHEDSIQSIADDVNGIQEFESMYKIPSIDRILEDKLVQSLTLKWALHFQKARNFHKRVVYSTPAIPFQLMQLPHVYHKLYQRYTKHGCPTCKEAIWDPLLCLFCGRLCFLPMKSLCQCRETDCENHVMACGAGIGVFLMINSTRIWLIGCSSGIYWPSPYLDANGAEDVDMIRKMPLFLNEDRYAALAYAVASHTLDRNSLRS